MREFKIYPSNLRHHKKTQTAEQNVRVNVIFQPSLASGKPRIELNKVHRSMNTGKVSFVL